MKNYFLLSLCTVAVFSASAAWDGTTQEFSKGDGSYNSPYLIENEQQLAYFQQQVTDGTTYEGMYIRLENDLDMSADAGMKILPIGFFDEYVNSQDPEGGMIDDSHYFLGTFDGNFKTIDNIHIEYIASDFEAVGGTGLFACLNDGSMVKNVIMGSRAIVTGGELTAGLVGQINGGTIQCCAVLATINSASTFGSGGIAGVGAGGKIDRCYFGGTLNGNSDVGGIVGTAMYGVEITNCYNRGLVSAPNGWYVGGIVGSAYDEGTRIAYCYNVGTIDGYNGFVSQPQPIVGDADYKVVVENCYFLDNGTFVETDGVVKKSEDEMKSEDFVAELNADNASTHWQMDTQAINDGYPVLAWQNDESAGVALHAIETLNAYTVGNTLYINTADATQGVNIYDMRGALVYSGSENVVTLPVRGIFVVVAGNKVTKVKM